MFCPVCKINEIDSDDLFCFRCGRNIHVHDFELKDVDVEDVNDIQKFRLLNYQLERMVNVEITVEEQQEYLSALNKILNVLQNDVKSIENLIKDLENGIKALNSFTFSNLKAKILRNKKEKLKKLNKKLSETEIYYHILKIQEDVTIRYLEVAMSDMDQLTDRLSKKIEIKKWKKNYIRNISSQRVDVFYQKNKEILDDIEKIQAELAVIASKLRRLEISNKFFDTTLKDLEKIEQIEEKDETVNPTKILNDHTLLFDIKNIELPAKKFYAGSIRRKLQGAIAYGNSLGSISLLIPNAGSISLNTFYDGIIPNEVNKDGMETIDYIIENHEELKKNIKQKNNYLNSMLSIIHKTYRNLKDEINDKERERAKLEIQIVESKDVEKKTE